MPFNEKGEFIRNSHTPSTPPKRGETTSSSQGSTDPITADDLITITKGLAALGLLVGLIWLVITFREWIAMALVLWIASWARRLWR